MTSKNIYSLDKFESLIEFRGISRLRTDYNEQDSDSLLTSKCYQAGCAGSTRDINLLSEENSSTSHQIIKPDSKYLSAHNPDYFYCYEDLESFLRDRNFDPTDDLFYTYKLIDEAEQRKDLSSLLKFKYNNSFKEAIAKNSEAYNQWEQHDMITEFEILKLGTDMSDKYPEISGSGGIYNPQRRALSSISSHEVTESLKLAPSSKYRDSIHLECQSTKTLKGLTSSLKYKNNLSTIISGSDGIDYLLVCCESSILVFEFDACSNSPRTDPSLTLETRPLVTSVSDRISSTWPFYPYNLNTIITRADWINGSVVVACSDDGGIHIWCVEFLVSQIKRLKSMPDNLRYESRVATNFSLKLDASAWGIDVKTAIDPQGCKHHILAAAANTKSVTLFYYHENSGSFSKIETHSVLHNIPDVSIIDYTVKDIYHHASISCVTISGELIIFKFEFRHRKLSPIIKSTDANEFLFEDPTVYRRSCLGSDCWTSKPIHSKYFKKVQSLRAMTGNFSIDEEGETARILLESKIFLPISDPSSSSDLGIASRWQFFETPVVDLTSRYKIHDDAISSKFCCLQEDYKRIHLVLKNIDDSSTEVDNPSMEEVFLAVSTDKRLGLFRANTLFCAAATNETFDLDIFKDEDKKWSNRISITDLIPELSAFIAVTQSGLVTIMRLCEYRGVYGMRQEHLFPNAQQPTSREGEFRTIIGMTVRSMSPVKDQHRFFLYLIYSDGFTMTFQLKSHIGFWEM
ncbi:hypothetical protein JCM33374_g572 [Metschnikowia sp. JCM 33374]|nr:hypothetical protein JCM33374_g572 [Metschnikowia sp. JCM 33374]